VTDDCCSKEENISGNYTSGWSYKVQWVL
jgi:hypothetical protein